MQTSQEISALVEALAKAQGSFGIVPKGGQNKHLHYSYATLDEVLEAVRKPLTDNGLAIVQAPGTYGSENLVRLTTMLAHISGQWLEVITEIPVSQQKGLSPAQTVGVAITYARRYALMSLLGIAAEGEDTDGTITVTDERKVNSTREITEPKSGAGAAQRDEVLAAINDFKANLLWTRTDADIRGCLDNLKALLPGFDETKHWGKILDLADERKKVLANRPPPPPIEDDIPSESDRKAIEGSSLPAATPTPADPQTAATGLPKPFNGISDMGGDPEEPAHDPDTGEILDPHPMAENTSEPSNVVPIKKVETEQGETPEMIGAMIQGFKDSIRLARSINTINSIVEDALTPFYETHKQVIDSQFTSEWKDLREFCSARLRVLEAKKANGK